MIRKIFCKIFIATLTSVAIFSCSFDNMADIPGDGSVGVILDISFEGIVVNEAGQPIEGIEASVIDGRDPFTTPQSGKFIIARKNITAVGNTPPVYIQLIFKDPAERYETTVHPVQIYVYSEGEPVILNDIKATLRRKEL